MRASSCFIAIAGPSSSAGQLQRLEHRLVLGGEERGSRRRSPSTRTLDAEQRGRRPARKPVQHRRRRDHRPPPEQRADRRAQHDRQRTP